MRILLHILTKPDDALAAEIIALQQQNKKNTVIVADLSKSQPEYKELLENIFAADAVQSW
jgi:hypothetical protein